MSKRFLTIAATMLLAASAFAIPAKRVKRQVQQPDGTVLTVMLRGDENFHFTSTEDGQPLVQRADGSYCYAMLDANGQLQASAQVAHNEAQRDAAELSFLKNYSNESLKVRSLGVERAKKSNARRMARLAKRGSVDASGKPMMRSQMAGATGEDGVGVTGKKRGLVILVNFKDKQMQSKHTQQEWNDYFNKEGYNREGCSGSVHDYFYEQSYGKFDLEFDVVGPVTVSKNMSAYGANDANGDDIDPAGMIVEACKLAYEKEQMDMSQYDWDEDGAVDQVYVIYAGYGEAAGAPANTIWPHEWDISDSGYSLVLGGKRIRTYACSSELNGSSGTAISGIGTACHEFSHCMGLPDLYDTAGGGCFGMDAWDLMDYGSYGDDGYKPTGYNTYEKWVSGWMTPTILKSPCFVKDMKPLNTAPESYVVFNEAKPTEYYIFENRQLQGTDSQLPNHGMLVIHVDYDAKSWNDNVVNNTYSHQRFTVVPADNKLTTETIEGDTYPGTTRSTELTDTSKPAAKLFNKNSDGRFFLGKPVTEITEQNKLISFTFMGGKTLNVPETSLLNMTENTFTAGWNAVADAETYNVELREKSAQIAVEEAQLISEDLSTWGKTLTADGNTDISAKLDTYMQTSGWTGEKVYECPGCAKLGSSKARGYLASPLISDHTTAKVTVRLNSSVFGKDAAESVVSIVDNDGNTISEQTIEADGKMATIVLDNAEEKDYKVMVSPKKRGYVFSIAAYDGEYSAEDFLGANAIAPKAVMKAAATRYTGITETSKTFDNLTPGAQYQWRVQAVAGSLLSAWSDWQTVDLSTYTDISEVEQSATLADADLVQVYSPVGVALGRMTYGDFRTMVLPAGVYVVKSSKATLKVAK